MKYKALSTPINFYHTILGSTSTAVSITTYLALHSTAKAHTTACSKHLIYTSTRTGEEWAHSIVALFQGHVKENLLLHSNTILCDTNQLYIDYVTTWTSIQRTLLAVRQHRPLNVTDNMICYYVTGVRARVNCVYQALFERLENEANSIGVHSPSHTHIHTLPHPTVTITHYKKPYQAVQCSAYSA